MILWKGDARKMRKQERRLHVNSFDKHTIDKCPYIVTYTVFFMIVCIFAFGWYFAAGRTFVWKGDGYKQHYKALVYYGEYFRSIIKNIVFKHKFEFPMWDFSIGEGSDILTTLHYYVIGDPLNVLAVFVPTKYMWVLYDFLILIRLYLAGLVFSVLCFRTGQCNKYGVLTGALSYAFCAWALVNVVRHPFFLNPMIYLPLLILGVEEFLCKSRPRLLVAAVFLSAVSNIYFFYMLVLITVIYVVHRLFILYRKVPLKAIKIFFEIGGYSLMGVLMAAFITLPMLMVLFSNGRLTVEYGFRMLYPLSYYSNLPAAFLASGDNHSLRVQCSVMAIPSFLLMFRKKRQNGMLKSLFCICVAIMFLPVLGQILNGFSYITNRWCWGFALLCAYIITVMWDSLMNLSCEEARFLICGCACYMGSCMLFRYSRTTETFISMGLLFLLLLLLIFRGGGEKRYRISYCQMLAVGITLISIMNHSFWLNTVDGEDNVSQCCMVSEIADLRRTEAAVVKLLAEENGIVELYRYSGHDMTQNAGMIEGISSTAYYWSIANPYVTSFRSLCGLYDDSSYNYSDYGVSAILNSLASVCYYTMNHGNLIPPPYGFVHVADKNAKNEETAIALESLKRELGTEAVPAEQAEDIYSRTALNYAVYRNDYALPLAYSYKDCMSVNTWKKLNAVEKREALLQNIVLNIEENETEPELSSHLLDYEIICDDNYVTCRENAFVVTSAGASVTLDFHGMENCETYLLINGFDFNETYEYELYFGDETVDPLNLYTRTQWKLLSDNKRKSIIRTKFYESEADRIPITIRAANGTTVTLKYSTPYNSFYNDRHDFAFGFGYTEEPMSSVTITFPLAGVYTYSDIEIACQPMDRYSTHIDELRKDTLDNMEMGVNTVSGTIDLNTDKWLCFAIPYSDGWRAYIDGEETELHQANIQYMAVRISAGEHTVRLVYETPWLQAGLYVSLGTCAGLIVWAIIGGFNKRKQTGKKVA